LADDVFDIAMQFKGMEQSGTLDFSKLQGVNLNTLKDAGIQADALRFVGATRFTKEGGELAKLQQPANDLAISMDAARLTLVGATGERKALTSILGMADSWESEGAADIKKGVDYTNSANDDQAALRDMGVDDTFVTNLRTKTADMTGRKAVLDMLVSLSGMALGGGQPLDKPKALDPDEDGSIAKILKDAKKEQAELQAKMQKMAEDLKAEREAKEKAETRDYIQRLGREYQVAGANLIMARKSLSTAIASGDKAAIENAASALMAAAQTFNQVKGVVDAMRKADTSDDKSANKEKGVSSEDVASFNQQMASMEEQTNPILEEIASGTLSAQLNVLKYGSPEEKAAALKAIGGDFGDNVTEGMTVGAIVRQVLRAMGDENTKGAAKDDDDPVTLDEELAIDDYASGDKVVSSDEGRKRVQDLINLAGKVANGGDVNASAQLASMIKTLLADTKASPQATGLNLSETQRDGLTALALVLEQNLGNMDANSLGKAKDPEDQALLKMQGATAQVMLADVMRKNGGTLSKKTTFIDDVNANDLGVVTAEGKTLGERAKEANELIVAFQTKLTNKDPNAMAELKTLVDKLGVLLDPNELKAMLPDAGDVLGQILKAGENNSFTGTSSSVQGRLNELSAALGKLAAQTVKGNETPEPVTDISSGGQTVQPKEPVITNHRTRTNVTLNDIMESRGNLVDYDRLADILVTSTKKRAATTGPAVTDHPVNFDPRFKMANDQIDAANVKRDQFDVTAEDYFKAAQDVQGAQNTQLNAIDVQRLTSKAVFKDLTAPELLQLQNAAASLLTSGLPFNDAERKALFDLAGPQKVAEAFAGAFAKADEPGKRALLSQFKALDANFQGAGAGAAFGDMAEAMRTGLNAASEIRQIDNRVLEINQKLANPKKLNPGEENLLKDEKTRLVGADGKGGERAKAVLAQTKATTDLATALTKFTPSAAPTKAQVLVLAGLTKDPTEGMAGQIAAKAAQAVGTLAATLDKKKGVMEDAQKAFIKANAAAVDAVYELRKGLGSGLLGGEYSMPGSLTASIDAYLVVNDKMLAYQGDNATYDQIHANNAGILSQGQKGLMERRSGLLSSVEEDGKGIAAATQKAGKQQQGLDTQLKAYQTAYASANNMVRTIDADITSLQGQRDALSGDKKKVADVAVAYQALKSAWEASGGTFNTDVMAKAAALEGLLVSAKSVLDSKDFTSGTTLVETIQKSKNTTAVNALLGNPNDKSAPTNDQGFGAGLANTLGKIDLQLQGLNGTIGAKQQDRSTWLNESAKQKRLVDGVQVQVRDLLKPTDSQDLSQLTEALSKVKNYSLDASRVLDVIGSRLGATTKSDKDTPSSGMRVNDLGTRRALSSAEQMLLADATRLNTLKKKLEGSGSLSTQEKKDLDASVRTELTGSAMGLLATNQRLGKEETLKKAENNYIDAQMNVYAAQRSGASKSEIRDLQKTANEARHDFDKANGRTWRDALGQMFAGDGGQQALMAFKQAMEMLMEAIKQEKRVRELEGLLAKAEAEEKQLMVEMALYAAGPRKA
jgi:hypothetical protein